MKTAIVTTIVSFCTALTLTAQDLPAKSEKPKDEAAPSLMPKPEAPEGYVTREEYDTLLKRVLELEKRLGSAEEKSVAREKEVDESLDELEKKNKEAHELAATSKPGTTNFLLTGYGFAGFEDRPGEGGKFVAGFSPILLWKLNERLFFESELELELGPEETELHLEYANLSYLLNDYMTVKAGKFLTPFGTFADRLHAAWINKLPDQPIAVGEEGIAPFAQVGAQLSGGFPLGPTKFNYALYAVNGPDFVESDEPEEIGRLDFEKNFTGVNSRAYGGRIGFLPIPELELGYSFQYVNGPIDARLHAVDLSYTREFDWLKGTLDVRGQWVWSNAGSFRFVPESEDEETEAMPIIFNNRRDGGYAQIAYRPTKAKSELLRRFELVGRYDKLNQPSGFTLAPDEERWTVGLNYWLGDSTVLKGAYEFIHRRRSEGAGDFNGNALLFQAAMGF